MTTCIVVHNVMSIGSYTIYFNSKSRPGKLIYNCFTSATYSICTRVDSHYSLCITSKHYIRSANQLWQIKLGTTLPGYEMINLVTVSDSVLANEPLLVHRSLGSSFLLYLGSACTLLWWASQKLLTKKCFITLVTEELKRNSTCLAVCCGNQKSSGYEIVEATGCG